MKNTSGKRPFMNRVLVLVDVEPETTKGGILLPEDVKRKQEQKREWGVLIAVGADAWEGSDDKCNIGDRVEFSKCGGKYDVGADGKNYRLLDSHDILSIEIA